ncbi:MAG: hypothetical protein IIC30_02270 [Chloroflexi bacterium]|nr:hypothetical protein [Chloroflexota bacterium]
MNLLKSPGVWAILIALSLSFYAGKYVPPVWTVDQIALDVPAPPEKLSFWGKVKKFLKDFFTREPEPKNLEGPLDTFSGMPQSGLTNPLDSESFPPEPPVPSPPDPERSFWQRVGDFFSNLFSGDDEPEPELNLLPDEIDLPPPDSGGGIQPGPEDVLKADTPAFSQQVGFMRKYFLRITRPMSYYSRNVKRRLAQSFLPRL